MPDLIDELAKRNGFTNANEMWNMIAKVDLVTPGNRAIFQKWKEEDGTKEGLLKLFPKKDDTNKEL